MSKWIDYDAIDYRFDRIQDESPDFIGGVIYANACVMDAPSIDIEPKRGEWILLEPRYPIEQKVYWNKEQALADTKGNGARERRRCSCCGYTKSFMCHMKDEQIKLWNFCPNCGADMRGKDDECVL